jgi:hypothetical protein
MKRLARTALAASLLLLALPGAGAAAAPDTAPPREPPAVQREEAARSTGLRLGMSWPSTRATSDHATSVGLLWAYDARDFLAEISVDGAWSRDVHQVTAGFGASYPFSATNLSPYAGAGLRYAWAGYGNGDGHGFQPYAAAGLLLGRLSTVNVRLQAEYWLNTFHTGGEQVRGAGLSLGLGF